MQAHLVVLVWKADPILPLSYVSTKHNLNFAASLRSFTLLMTLLVLGFSHELGRQKTMKAQSGRLCVCGREHEGETVITNSLPGSTRSVD